MLAQWFLFPNGSYLHLTSRKALACCRWAPAVTSHVYSPGSSIAVGAIVKDPSSTTKDRAFRSSRLSSGAPSLYHVTFTSVSFGWGLVIHEKWADSPSNFVTLIGGVAIREPAEKTKKKTKKQCLIWAVLPDFAIAWILSAVNSNTYWDYSGIVCFESLSSSAILWVESLGYEKTVESQNPIWCHVAAAVRTHRPFAWRRLAVGAATARCHQSKNLESYIFLRPIAKSTLNLNAIKFDGVAKSINTALARFFFSTFSNEWSGMLAAWDQGFMKPWSHAGR